MHEGKAGRFASTGVSDKATATVYNNNVYRSERERESRRGRGSKSEFIPNAGARGRDRISSDSPPVATRRVRRCLPQLLNVNSYFVIAKYWRSDRSAAARCASCGAGCKRRRRGGGKRRGGARGGNQCQERGGGSTVARIVSSLLE